MKKLVHGADGWAIEVVMNRGPRQKTQDAVIAATHCASRMPLSLDGGNPIYMCSSEHFRSDTISRQTLQQK